VNDRDVILAVHLARDCVRWITFVGGEVLTARRQSFPVDPAGAALLNDRSEAVLETVFAEHRSGARADRIVMALSAPKMFLRFLKLPVAAGKDLERIVAIQTEVELPVAPDTLACGWCRTAKAASGKQPVAICATDRNDVDRLRALAERARVEIELLALDPFAVLGFCNAFRAESADPVLVVSRYAGRPMACVIRSRTLEYARVGSTACDPPGDARALERLAAFVDEALTYLENERPDLPPLGRLLLIAADSDRDEFSGALGQRLAPRGIHLEENSLGSLPWKSDEPPAGYEVALGMAALAQDPAAVSANLEAGARRPRVFRAGAAPVRSAALALVTLLALIASGWGVTALNRGRIRMADETIQAQRALVDDIAGLRDRKELLENVRAEMVPALEVLTELGTLIPGQVVVQRIELNPDKPCRIEGQIKDPSQLGDFLKKLDESPLLRKALYQRVETTPGKKISEFALTFLLDRTPEGKEEHARE